MVEAVPGSPSPQRLAQLEARIFAEIDEEIRAFHTWCKEMVTSLTRRIEAIATWHRTAATLFLRGIRQN